MNQDTLRGQWISSRGVFVSNGASSPMMMGSHPGQVNSFGRIQERYGMLATKQNGRSRLGPRSGRI